MTKTLLFTLWVVFLSTQAFTQEVNIIKNDGGNVLFNLSEIDSITFSLQDTLAPPVNARDKLQIHTQSGTFQLPVSEIDSVYFNPEGTVAFFQTTASLNQIALAEIDSITFGSNLDSTVYISYDETTVSVTNPLAFLGVSVEASGADVTVTSTAAISDITYVLSGVTADGMFKIYSEKRLQLRLEGIQITNPDGPAINIQSSKKITVQLADGSDNIFSDGTTYAPPPNNEDQSAAFFSEGQLIFEGSGSLAINGVGENEHGLRSDDYIKINQGNITIHSAVKDGIHAKDGFFMNGGSVAVTAQGDGIDGGGSVIEIADGSITIQNSTGGSDAMKCDSTILITGGSIQLTVGGDRSKGLNSKQDIRVAGGTLGINTTGSVVLEPSGSGFEPSYCTAIKAGARVAIESGSITIQTSGGAGRGISCDGDILISSGTLAITSSGDGNAYTNELGQPDACLGHCLNSNGNMDLTGGDITLNHSGDGGKGISSDGDLTIGTAATVPLIHITTTGQPVTIVPGPNGEYAEAKAISVDSAITVANGNITIASADDGMKSKQSITINAGIIYITNSFEGIESPNIFINGGEVSVKSSDDGLNATYGDDSHFNDGSILTINGGYVYVSATGGDPIDSNGNFYMNGGILVAHGPQSSPEVGVDVNGDFIVTGGFMVVSGTNSNMTQGPILSSTQRSVLLRTSTSISPGILFHIEDTNGNSLLTFAPERRYYSMIFSAPELSAGISYRLYTGGSSTGTVVNGLYSGGSYSGGTLRSTFNLTNMAQTVWF